MKGVRTMKYVVAVLCVVVALETALLVRGFLAERPVQAAEPVSGLGKVLAIKSRERQAEAILSARNEAIQSLMNTVRLAEQPGKGKQEPQEGEFHSEKHIAIILLGGLRASEAVEVLLDNLLYRVPPAVWSTRPIPAEEWCPAAVALIRIGIPSVEPVLESLEATESDDVARLCTWVVVEILGKDLGRLKIQVRLAAAKSRLESAQPPEIIQDQIKAWQAAIEKGSLGADARVTAMETVKALQEQLEIPDFLRHGVGRLEAALEARYFGDGYSPYVLKRRTIDVRSVYSDLRER